jgi:integrase
MTDKQHIIDSVHQCTDEITRLYDQYEKECRYIKNFTPKTLKTYREIFDRWVKYVGHNLPSAYNLTQFIIGMKEAGLSDVTVNISIQGFNSFLAWLEEKKEISHLKLKKVKEEKKVMRVFTDDEVKKIMSFKLRLRGEWRRYTLLCLLLDTGIRITEALTIEPNNVDLENLLIKVYGKGRKEELFQSLYSGFQMNNQSLGRRSLWSAVACDAAGESPLAHQRLSFHQFRKRRPPSFGQRHTCQPIDDTNNVDSCRGQYIL